MAGADEYDRIQLELGFRMKALEDKVGETAKHTDTRLDQLGTQIANLAFVPRGEYMIEMKAMAEKVEAAHRLSMWALGVIVSGLIVAILVSLVLKVSA